MVMCQSCGMQVEDESDFGTMDGGSKSDEYCIHCYKDGQFTFNGSFEEFVEKQTDLSIRLMGISPVDAENRARDKLPTLRRWKGQLAEDEEDADFLD